MLFLYSDIYALHEIETIDNLIYSCTMYSKMMGFYLKSEDRPPYTISNCRHLGVLLTLFIEWIDEMWYVSLQPHQHLRLNHKTMILMASQRQWGND